MRGGGLLQVLAGAMGRTGGIGKWSGMVTVSHPPARRSQEHKRRRVDRDVAMPAVRSATLLGPVPAATKSIAGSHAGSVGEEQPPPESSACFADAAEQSPSADLPVGEGLAPPPLDIGSRHGSDLSGGTTVTGANGAPSLAPDRVLQSSGQASRSTTDDDAAEDGSLARQSSGIKAEADVPQLATPALAAGLPLQPDFLAGELQSDST